MGMHHFDTGNLRHDHGDSRKLFAPFHFFLFLDVLDHLGGMTGKYIHLAGIELAGNAGFCLFAQRSPKKNEADHS
jgi:hypothetical protein